MASTDKKLREENLADSVIDPNLSEPKLGRTLADADKLLTFFDAEVGKIVTALEGNITADQEK